MSHPVSPNEWPLKPRDTSYRVELPERNSAYFPEKRDFVSPTSPSLASPGLESVHDLNPSEKEPRSPFYEPAEKEVYNSSTPEPVDTNPRFRARSHRRRWLWCSVAAVILLAIGLGVGLGVGLTRKNSNDATNSSASAHGSSRTLSTTGAFNGSGIALASESFNASSYGSIVMYFQHHTGQIRYTQLATDGSWKGGDATEVVAVDAKNGTPIAAVAYARNNTAAWHIFYINTDNFITEVTNSNTTNVWAPGPINDLKLQAMDDPNVGLEACWYGSFYSDASYNHSPVPGQNQATGNSSDQTVGIHLWYATNSTAFDSVGWSYGDTSWSKQQTFDGYNGHAGVGCYSWGPGSDTYVMLVDLNNNVNILWKDLNTTASATDQHPINTWTNSKVTIPAYQNSSLGFTNYLYVQNPDLTVSGFNVTWAAENSSIDASETFVVNGEKGLPGTHLSVTALPNQSGGNSLLTFYQTNGSDITEFVRDLDGGQWTSSSVPIPNS